MKNQIIILLFLASALVSCAEQQMAKIEYKDDGSSDHLYEKTISKIDSDSGLVSRKLNRSSNAIRDIESEASFSDNNVDILKNPSLNLDDGLFIIVRPGDNLLNISKEYDIDFSALVKENNLKKPYDLELGQILKIPTYGNFEKKTETSKLVETERAAPVVLTNTKAQFIMPIDKGNIIFSFGEETDIGIKNEGINFKVSAGSNIYSVASGVVVYASNKLEDYGNLVIVKHDHSLATIYAHLDEILVKKGQEISLGHIVGKVGSTGNVSFPQLHFAVRKNKKTVDPALYIPKKN